MKFSLINRKLSYQTLKKKEKHDLKNYYLTKELSLAFDF